MFYPRKSPSFLTRTYPSEQVCIGHMSLIMSGFHTGDIGIISYPWIRRHSICPGGMGINPRVSGAPEPSEIVSSPAGGVSLWRSIACYVCL